jgi:hypothetical protein
MNGDIGIRYQIIVNGWLDPDWSNWLDGFELRSIVRPDGTEVTTITGELADQAALRGVLNKILDLNLELLSLEQMKESPGTEYSGPPAREGRY